MPEDALFGGGSIAEALTHRQTRIINKGGVAGLKEAAASVLPSLQDPARKAGYLLSLQQSKLGQDVLAEEIDQLFDSLLVSPSSINSIVKDNLAPNRKMEKITSIFYAIRSSQMTEQRRMQLTERLDELLSQYIVNDKILEKIDVGKILQKIIPGDLGNIFEMVTQFIGMATSGKEQAKKKQDEAKGAQGVLKAQISRDKAGQSESKQNQATAKALNRSRGL